jgi:arsenite methyltransferase
MLLSTSDEIQSMSFFFNDDQWVAHTFYDDLPAYYEKLKDALKMPRKLFVTTVALWDAGLGVVDGAFMAFQLGFLYVCPCCLSAYRYQDYLDAKADQTNSTAYFVEGGVKPWLSKFGDQEDLVGKD